MVFTYILTIAFDISFKKFIEWSFVLKFIEHPCIMVIRHTGILRISYDVNDLWKVILTSSEFSTEEIFQIRIRLQNRVAIPKASVHSVRFSLRQSFSTEFELGIPSVLKLAVYSLSTILSKILPVSKSAADRYLPSAT